MMGIPLARYASRPVTGRAESQTLFSYSIAVLHPSLKWKRRRFSRRRWQSKKRPAGLEVRLRSKTQRFNHGPAIWTKQLSISGSFSRRAFWLDGAVAAQWKRALHGATTGSRSRHCQFSPSICRFGNRPGPPTPHGCPGPGWERHSHRYLAQKPAPWSRAAT